MNCFSQHPHPFDSGAEDCRANIDLNKETLHKCCFLEYNKIFLKFRNNCVSLLRENDKMNMTQNVEIEKK